MLNEFYQSSPISYALFTNTCSKIILCAYFGEIYSLVLVNLIPKGISSEEVNKSANFLA